VNPWRKDYEAKWPKAVEKVVKDTDAMLAFFDFPAEHWVHLKTTNPIESTLVRAGVLFEKGVMAERSETDENEVAA
jgi:transposase-like protein